MPLQLETLESRTNPSSFSLTFNNTSNRTETVYMSLVAPNQPIKVAPDQAPKIGGYWALPTGETDPNGKTLTLVQGKGITNYDLFEGRKTTTFTIEGPVISGRLYLSFGTQLPSTGHGLDIIFNGPPPLDPAVSDIKYDYIELNQDTSGLTIDVTQVDHFGFPVKIDSIGQTVGVDWGTRTEIFKAFQTYIQQPSVNGTPYSGLVTDERILNPGQYFAYGGNRQTLLGKVFDSVVQTFWQDDKTGPSLTLHSFVDKKLYTSKRVVHNNHKSIEFSTPGNSNPFYVYSPSDAPGESLPGNPVPSEEVFACTGVFSDYKTQETDPTRQSILADLQFQIAAAFNRGIATTQFTGNTTDAWAKQSNWYPGTTAENLYAKFMHSNPFFSGNKAYAFQADEGGAAPKINNIPDGSAVTVTLGAWAPPNLGKAIPIVSGKTTKIWDEDGSLVQIKLFGPGNGVLKLANGSDSRGQMDSLILSGTTLESSLYIIVRGGSVSGTTVNSLSINGLLDNHNAIGRIDAPKVDLAAGGLLCADGNLGWLRLGDLKTDSEVSINGNFTTFTTNSLWEKAFVHAIGNFNSFFVSNSLADGSKVTAGGRLGEMNVRGNIVKSTVNGGLTGIGFVKAGNILDSLIQSLGPIEKLQISKDLIGTSVASNVDAGPDGQHGTQDDRLQDPFAFGSIGSIVVGGILKTNDLDTITTNGTIGSVTVKGKKIPNGSVYNGVALHSNVGGAVKYDLWDYMGWSKTTAPGFQSDVSYTSDAAEAWKNLKIINYEPSHFPNFNTNGGLVQPDLMTPIPDPSFQKNIGTDFSPGAQGYGTYVNYIWSNPQLMIDNDMKQIQAAGFDGVRIYGGDPNVAVATLLAANKLSNFHVYYEVPTPDLSVGPYTAGASAETELYQNLIGSDRPPATPEGALQQLHYVINIVGPAVFAKTIPLVFFTHEMMVAPKGSAPGALPTSTPLLKWGINATRAVLARELAGQPLPAVTTALVAGQVVQDGTPYFQNVKTLVNTIQADTNSPIAYDNYPFQWGNRYFNQQTAGLFDSISPAYLKGQPLPTAAHTAQETVTQANLKFSLQWITTEVNRIWGQNGSVKQLIAETGWATDGNYQPNPITDPNELPIVGNTVDASAYFKQLQGMGFKVNNVPVMYFMAYDVPVKSLDANMFSENHYGIFGWSNKPKFAPDQPQFEPLTKPFAVVAMQPYWSEKNPTGKGVPFAPVAQTGISTTYTISNGTNSVDVPWFWGVTIFQNQTGNPTNQTADWIRPGSFLITQGVPVTVTTSNPDPAATKSVTFTLGNPDPNNQGIAKVTSSDFSTIIYATLTQANPPFGGQAVTFATNWNWLHNGNQLPSDLVPDPTLFKPIFADFWAS